MTYAWVLLFSYNLIEKQITFRQGEFKIGTNFDPKEFVFRNFLYAMNEASKPALMYSFESAQEEDEHGFVMKVVWVNPNGDVDYVAEESLSNNSINKDTIKPDFKTPMMSGIWTVMVLNAQNNELLARIPFLIIPTENAIAKLCAKAMHQTKAEIFNFFFLFY